MLQQTVLDLRRRDEDARDFQHLVRAPVIPVVAFRVHVKLIARRAPIARESLFRFLVRVPIAERGGVTLDAQRAHLAR